MKSEVRGQGGHEGVKLYKASQAGSGLCLPPYMRRQGLWGDLTSVWKRSPCCYVKSSHRKEPPRDRWQQQSRWETVVSWARILVLKEWEAGGQDMLQKLGQYDALVNWARIRKKGAKGDTRFGPWATGRMELLIPEMGACRSSSGGEGRVCLEIRLALLSTFWWRGERFSRRKWWNARRGQVGFDSWIWRSWRTLVTLI